MKIEDQGNGGITLKAEDDKLLILVVSRKTVNWQEIEVISEEDNKLAVRQYQFGDRDYPMLGIEENPIIKEHLPNTAKAINLIFSSIGNFEKFKKIILVIHDQELFEDAGQYSTNQQKLEKKGSATLEGCNAFKPTGDFEDKIQYLISKAFKGCDIVSTCEIELWSFQHEGSRINDALTSEKNVYDEMITALTPNFKKKLVDIKFRTLQLLLPLHIDFMGLSECNETKRNMYWDTIKKISFSDDQYNKTLNEVCSLIDGDESDNVESISSFATDAGFDDDTNWIELKILIGKDSNVNSFFRSVSNDDLSKVVDDIKKFNFSSGKNGHILKITGWVDWHASIVEHFDALIAAC